MGSLVYFLPWLLLGTSTGLLLGTHGFLVMRNPMCLALSSRQKGYCQRMVLDRTMRIQLRVLGVLVCLFGAILFTGASLDSMVLLNLFRVANVLNVVEAGLWILWWSIFLAALGAGLVLEIRQLIRGEPFHCWRMWKVSAILPPIDVFPPVTPKMQQEARFFTIALVSSVVISVGTTVFCQP